MAVCCTGLLFQLRQQRKDVQSHKWPEQCQTDFQQAATLFVDCHGNCLKHIMDGDLSLVTASVAKEQTLSRRGKVASNKPPLLRVGIKIYF